MAAITFTVNDALVPRIAAGFRIYYPDLIGTDGQVIRQGVIRLVADTLAPIEAQQAANTLGAQAQTVYTTQLGQSRVDVQGGVI